ncbi:MAG: septation ring formation regulator EzrA [Bacilli bacterium]|nr:septation ring formation regulator EzrA [Bacilli bacterium]
MKDTYILFGVAYLIITIALIITMIVIVKKHMKNKYNEVLKMLERDKNLIISASILTELNKVESLINNKELEKKYESWKEKFKIIKDKEVPKITDELINVEELINTKKYKEIEKELAKIELDIYFIKSKSKFLLDEIKEITTSEEKNREIVTKLKSEYREIFIKYNNAKEDYEIISSPIELQFETVDKLFSAFEISMENNAYTEVGKIVKALDDTIGNLSIVIEEAPSIILMGKVLIPKKMKDTHDIYEKMVKEGYNLDYLKIDYNMIESEKKIADIFDRLNVLNLVDSIFELKTILDYYDNLYNDFEKEKVSKRMFEEFTRTIGIRCKKILNIILSLNRKIDDIKYSYDLTEDEVKIIDEISLSGKSIKSEYETIIEDYRNKLFSYSKLAHQMELLNLKLSKTEDKLDYTLKSLGSLKEDELRAREQLEEIKSILSSAKEKITSYKLPVIPKCYYIELEEATEAIREMIKELEAKPINIKTLNIRVDNARDLVLKLYNTSNETIKTAWMAENAIIYGNRYRFDNKEIDESLEKASIAFMKGNFKLSLESSINAINIIEPGIHKRLLEAYKK